MFSVVVDPPLPESPVHGHEAGQDRQRVGVGPAVRRSPHGNAPAAQETQPRRTARSRDRYARDSGVRGSLEAIERGQVGRALD